MISEQLKTPSAATKMPLHLQISDMLAREIQSGILVDGEKLAPERQMAARLSISVGTLRKALQELQDKGMLQRIQGSGNYVNHHPDADNVYALFRLELINEKGAPTAELLGVERRMKPDDLPAFGQSSHAFRFRRLRRIGGTIAALEEIWLDGSYAQSISAKDVSDSMYLFYKEHLGFWIARTEDRVSVASTPAWAPTRWTLGEQNTGKRNTHKQNSDKLTTCGYVERLSRDQHGRLAEFSRTWFDPNTVQFVSRR